MNINFTFKINWNYFLVELLARIGKKGSKMVVTKRQRREKPVKIEKRQFQGPEWGP